MTYEEWVESKRGWWWTNFYDQFRRASAGKLDEVDGEPGHYTLGGQDATFDPDVPAFQVYLYFRYLRVCEKKGQDPSPFVALEDFPDDDG